MSKFVITNDKYEYEDSVDAITEAFKVLKSSRLDEINPSQIRNIEFKVLEVFRKVFKKEAAKKKSKSEEQFVADVGAYPESFMDFVACPIGTEVQLQYPNGSTWKKVSKNYWRNSYGDECHNRSMSAGQNRIIALPIHEPTPKWSVGNILYGEQAYVDAPVGTCAMEADAHSHGTIIQKSADGNWLILSEVQRGRELIMNKPYSRRVIVEPPSKATSYNGVRRELGLSLVDLNSAPVGARVVERDMELVKTGPDDWTYARPNFAPRCGDTLSSQELLRRRATFRAGLNSIFPPESAPSNDKDKAKT